MAESAKGRRTGSASKSTLADEYTQINILFPTGGLELPPAERFNAYPREAQQVVLEAFQREQKERLAWLANQQSHDYTLNLLARKQYFVWRLAGLLTSGFLTLTALVLGAWLVAHGAGGTGVAMMLGAAAALIGTAVYGHRTDAASTANGRTKDSEKEG